MKILFLCVENAGRSQMAEAFARKYAPPEVEVASAGSQPARQIHPAVAEAMREAGIEIGDRTPKGLQDLPEGVFDLAVGMGCGDACPAVRAKRMIQWEIPNPKDQTPAGVRKIRDEIDLKVRRLLATLTAPRFRLWPTVLSGFFLFLCYSFLILSSALLSPALSVPYPEKGLALVSGRTMQLREALSQISPWERRVDAFFDPSLGTRQELDQMFLWHREFVRLAKDPAIQANLPGIMTHANMLEAESGRLEILDKQTQFWIAKAPDPVPGYGLLLRAAYFKEPPPRNWPGLLRELLPPSWFRDRLEERLYRKTGEAARAQAIRQADSRASRRLLARYRWMTVFDLTLFCLFLVSLPLFLFQPRGSWKAGSAAIPLPWSFQTGMTVLIRGAALGMLLTWAVIFLPHSSNPSMLLLSSLLWTLPILLWTQRHLLRPNRLWLHREMGLDVPAKQWNKLLLIALLGLGADSLGSSLVGAAGSFFQLPNHWAESFDADLVWGTGAVFWSSLAGTVLVGPFFEELAFRGLLYGTMRSRFGRAAAMVLSAGFFSLMHGYGLLGFLTVFWSGVVFAWIYEESGSLWPSIAVHAAGNLLFSLNVILMLRL